MSEPSMTGSETAAAGAPFSELSARRLGPVRRYFVRHPVAMDVLVVVVVAVLGGIGVLLAHAEFYEGDGLTAEPSVLGVGLALLCLVLIAMSWRRRYPVTVAAVVAVLAVVATAVTGAIDGFDLALAFAIYAVAALRRPLVAWTALVATTALTAGAVWLWQGETQVVILDDAGSEAVTADNRVATMVSIAVVSLIAFAIGTSVRNRRQHVAELVERANALARDRDHQAQIARAGERARIAREMHDVVAHSLSVMIALADGAGVAMERSPERARTALDELSETGRAALADMRRVLGVLDEEPAPLEPAPGTPDLTELVERFRTAGLAVRAEGLRTEVPDDVGLQLAVYRIVQEALTNVLRHAPATPHVDVTITTGPGHVEVLVVDQGGSVPGRSSDGAGRGLIGMGERAGVYGGTVRAGPWRDGWRVHAVLPWEKEGRR